MKLNNFLVKAKKTTYATGKIKEKKLKNGCKEYTFEKENLKYRDRYFGQNPFIGEEIVWKNNKIFWGMNYYGKTSSNEISSKETYTFLKKALTKITKEHPFRGPKKFKTKYFTYTNEFKGNISNFSGKEKIYYKNKKIYFLHYHGGLIKEK